MATRQSTSSALIPAVCYLRMSSDKQEASIGDQRAAVHAYAAKHGYIIIAEYIDEGISGDNTAKRVAFQRMIADASKGTFKAVLCWDQDRFGRFDSIEAGRWIHPLREAGVKLDTVAQGSVDWSDFAGRMIFGIQQEGKHAFLRDLSRNVLRGQLATAKRGGWLGKAPLGYRIEGSKGNKRLLIADDTAVATVRRIFADYIAGHSLRAIAVRLNADLVLTPKQTGWSCVTLLGILTNVAYCGTYRWNAKHRGKYNGVAGDCVSAEVAKGSNDSAEWVVIEDHHEAIIDKQTFATVQTRLTERKRITTPHKSGGSFLLTGIIRCGKCGGVMAGRNSGGERYSCFNHQRKGGCDPNSILQDVLLPEVASAIREKLLTGNAIERLKDAIRRQLTTTPKVDAAKLGKELADVAGKIEKARRRLMEVDADMLAEVQQHLRGLREQRERLEASLKLAGTPLRQRRDEIGDSIDATFARVFRLEKLLRRGEPVMVRESLRSAVDRLDVWSDKVREGNRHNYRLQRGVIHFAATGLNNLFGKSYRT